MSMAAQTEVANVISPPDPGVGHYHNLLLTYMIIVNTANKMHKQTSKINLPQAVAGAMFNLMRIGAVEL